MSKIKNELNAMEYNQASEQWYEAEIRLGLALGHGNEEQALEALALLKSAVSRRFYRILSESEIVSVFLGILGGIIHFACRDAGMSPGHLTMLIIQQKNTLSPAAFDPDITLWDARLDSRLKTCVHDACSLLQEISIPEVSPLIQRCIRYIQSHLTDPLRVSQLAQAMNVTREYLSARFKKETGQTLTDYINCRRIHLSKYYLRENRFSVTQVSLLCGYADSNYFGRVFKKQEGITPKEYMLQNQAFPR